MKQVTVHAAKTNLSKLIDAAMAGEEIVIAKGSKPVVKLVAIPQGRFKLGLLEGQLGDGPDFLARGPDSESWVWEKDE